MKANIEFFGVGSSMDTSMLENLTQVVDDLAIDMEINHVSDITEFINNRLSGIPALKINDQIVSEGRIPSYQELRSFLEPLM